MRREDGGCVHEIEALGGVSVDGINLIRACEGAGRAMIWSIALAWMRRPPAPRLGRGHGRVTRHLRLRAWRPLLKARCGREASLGGIERKLGRKTS
jgi:hypothetical protein